MPRPAARRPARSGGRGRQQPAPEPATLPVLQVAGAVDIGAREVVAAVPPDRAEAPVRTFPTFTADLHALADWLLAHGVTTVAMESTGVYWIPVFQVLEARGLEVCLVNARHVKNVRGRKSDVSDVQWCQSLHAAGLLHASFRPADTVCAVRTVLRHREGLVAQTTEYIQHMHKALTQMNLQLHHVLSDVTGVSGLRILEAILAGERDPGRLADLRDPGVRAPRERVMAALEGDWRPEHLFVLRQALAAYRYCLTQVRECDAEVERLLAACEPVADADDVPPPPPGAPRGKGGKPRRTEMALPSTDLRAELFRLLGTDVTQCPGLGVASVAALYGELGGQLQAAFARANRFTRWLGLAPNPEVSGGRVVRKRGPTAAHRVAKIFRLAAQALHHSDTALGQFYRRMRTKLGAPAAITATAHKLARIYYHLVTTREAYDETIFARLERQHEERQLQRLHQLARKLGLAVVPLTQSEACVS